MKKKINYKGLILAAGRGSRMGKASANCSKCMIKIEEKSLIEYQLQSLKNAGLTKIAIVTGYKNQLLEKYLEKKIHNNLWEKTNMVYSMLCAKRWIDEPTIISYSDIIYPHKFVNELIKKDGDIVIVADTNWRLLWERRFENPLEDAESFYFKDDQLIEIGKKITNLDDIKAQYIGLLKITPRAINTIINLFEGNILKKLDFTSLLQMLIEKEVGIKIVFTKDKWFEIDNQKDLKIARDYLSNKKKYF